MTKALLPLLVLGAVMLVPLPATAAPLSPDFTTQIRTYEQTETGSTPSTGQRPQRTPAQPAVQQSAQVTTTQALTATAPLTNT
ncbi:MAG: hypothetical protein KDD91_22725, partial [Caldilinea sp.]|nr:hypothetical protein [Caldilinea sp.]